VECSLPKSQYDFVDPEVSFTANVSFKHFKFTFEPKVRGFSNFYGTRKKKQQKNRQSLVPGANHAAIST
jgi:hypothetical protein